MCGRSGKTNVESSGRARAVAVDLDGEKLAVAWQLGADFAINSSQVYLLFCLAKFISSGPDVVIEAAGNPYT